MGRTNIQERTAELEKEIEQLKAAEKKYRKIFEKANEGIFQSTADGHYIEVNPAFARIHGFSSPQEMIESITDIGRQIYVDPRERERFVQLLIEHDRVEKFELEAYRKDKSKCWVSVNAHTVRGGAGNIKFFEGTILDITDRKRAEEELRQSKEELERKVKERTSQLSKINEILLAEIEERKLTEFKLRAAVKNLRAMTSEVVMTEERSRAHFASDLHDSVVQTLAAAKLRSQLIQETIPKKSKPVYDELQDLVSESIIQAREIISELSPPVLNELGLVHALEWLADHVSKKHGLGVKFESRYEELPLPREIKVLLFQATRELLMNVVKHAQAPIATVKFSSFNDHKINIEVIDNGRGFDMKKTFKPDTQGGFGIYGIRERLQHFGGQLAIKSKPGKGTTVLILCPREIETNIPV